MRNGCHLSLRIAVAILVFVPLADAEEVDGQVVPASHKNVALNFQDNFNDVAAKPAPALVNVTHTVSVLPESNPVLSPSQSPVLPQPNARLFFLLGLFAVLGGRHLVRRR